jgi:dihydrofolate reductase
VLIYSAICSLDGYTEDAGGKFDWARPDEEVHAFVNDQERPIETYHCGRRMYETMVFWETMDDPDPVMRDYAEIWRAAEKIVYSRTLESPASERTRIEREFDPQAVSANPGKASIGGPELAAEALRAGIVDEIQLFVNPVIIGGGKRALPDRVRLDLRLVDQRRFENGTVFLHYAR